MPRRCADGVIQESCKFYEETEVPGAFALWSSLFTVSACLGRDCFIDQGHFKVYPNLYVVLSAGSGVCRKSTSINISSDFLNMLDEPPTILSQRITPEELIGTLSKKKSDDTKIVEESVGYFVADEISTLIDKTSGMQALIPILTKLYDGKDFDYATRSHGKEFVRNPCLGILGGSTVEWIKESFPAHSIGGGFTARIVFVYRQNRERSIPWPRRSAENAARFERIVHDLNQISKIRGPFGVNDGAIDMYSLEYEQFLNSRVATNTLTSRYAERRHVTLLKVAMSVCASRTDCREITEEDMLNAIKILRSSELGRETIMRKIVSEPVGDVCEHVVGLILSRKEISRSNLIYETRHKLNVRELNIILEGLQESGHVYTEKRGEKLFYLARIPEKEDSDINF